MKQIEVKLVKKEKCRSNRLCVEPKLEYSTHIQDYGWQGSKYDGEISGTTGESKRLEAIKINIKNAKYARSIKYQTHIQEHCQKEINLMVKFLELVD